MSETSTYQRLRAHLAYLRLAAAAEALPGELEHAKTNNLGPSAFLERLLDVEVIATEARRQAGLERFACQPSPWRIDDFDFDAVRHEAPCNRVGGRDPPPSCRSSSVKLRAA